MKNLLLITFCLFFIQTSFAQKQFNNWYFGYRCGMTFNNGTPSIISSNPMVTTDNSATVSDANGDVLFFANGDMAYNRNGNIMPNGSGLLGDTSGGQTATIVQLPGSDSLYYLFTVDAQARSNGLKYSVIDLSLDGGLGDIDTNKKNVTLIAPATEKVAPIRHANGKDAWILIHAWNSDAFMAYLLTDTGLSDSPVITHIGTVNTGGSSPGYNAQGQLTVNKANNKVAAATYSAGNIEIFDFDNSTGILSNGVTISQPSAWGLEFSPNGNLLYASCWFQSNLYQYDLTTYTTNAITASQVSLGTAPNEGYLQTGPDGKIYVAEYLTNYLGVINKPDSTGLACNFIDTGFYTGANLSSAGLVDKILVNPAFPTGLQTITSNNKLSISCYPSPSSGSFTIDMSGYIGDKQISIYDQLGQIVYQTQSSQNKIVVNNKFASGIYSVSVIQGTSREYARVVVE